MDFWDVLRKRRMVRAYASRAVERPVVERVVDAATRVPSAGFAQGQTFVVVTDPDRRNAIARVAGEDEFARRGYPRWLSSAPVHVVLCVDTRAYRRRYAASDKKASMPPDHWPVPYGYVDAGASLMALLLAATNEGLAAGFLGAHAIPGLRDLTGVPDDVEPVGIVTIGHAARTETRRATTLQRRRPRSEVVRWERW